MRFVLSKIRHNPVDDKKSHDAGKDVLEIPAKLSADPESPLSLIGLRREAVKAPAELPAAKERNHEGADRKADVADKEAGKVGII